MLHFIVFIKHLHKMCSQYTPPSLKLILSLRVRLVASVPTAVFQHYLKTTFDPIIFISLQKIVTEIGQKCHEIFIVWGL